ncbi:GlxA family transcriptional regulator [soil metagenome]
MVQPLALAQMTIDTEKLPTCAAKPVTLAAPVQRNAKSAVVSVWVLVYPGFQLLDATGPAQVFATTNDEATDAGVPSPYRVRLISMHGGAVASSSGVTVLTQALPRPAALRGSTLVIAGGAGVARAVKDAALVAWTQRAHGLVARCCSVCSGAFLLAAAGLLEGRRACTHWRDVAELQRHHPGVRVQDDALHVKDGSVYTSAGVTAGIDLCLSLVEEDEGRAAALSVAKRLVVHFKRPGGQRQFSSELLAQTAAGERGEGLAQRLMAWLKPRLRARVPVADMAAAMALSPRSLHRQLLAEAALTPAQFLARLRLESACGLLEAGTLSMKQVAHRSGFGSEYNLRRAFVLRLGVVPSAYRSRFA